MSETLFFTPRWASQFTPKHNLSLLPHESQDYFDTWTSICKSPPCFLFDPLDQSGLQYMQTKECIHAFNQADRAYQNLLHLLKQPHSAPLSSKHASNNRKNINKWLKHFNLWAANINQISNQKSALSRQEMPSIDQIDKLRRWLRNEYITLMRIALRQLRLRYFWKKTVLFQKQSLFLNQNPQYWSFLTDKVALQLLKQQATTATPTKLKLPQPNTKTKQQKTSTAQTKLSILLSKHHRQQKLAGIPTGICKDYCLIKPYKSIFRKRDLKQAKAVVAQAQQLATAPSNKYQVMSHTQLANQIDFTKQLLDCANTMHNQITHTSLRRRIWQRTKRIAAAIVNPIAVKLTGHIAIGPSQLPVAIRNAMINDIACKKILINNEADLLLQAMLNRVLLCTYTRKFTADDTIWNIHQQLSKQGLVLFSAKPILTNHLDDLGSDNVFIRQSQNLKQIAQICSYIIEAPYDSAACQRIKSQLLSLPILTALPHLQQKQSGHEQALNIYYDNELWEQIYCHHIVLHQSQLPTPNQIKAIEKSLNSLQEQIKTRQAKLRFFHRKRPSVRKAIKAVKHKLSQLQQQCMLRKSQHQDQDYNYNVHQNANDIASHLLNQEYDQAVPLVSFFAESDIAFVPTQHRSVPQKYLSLESNDVADALISILHTTFHQQMPWAPSRAHDCYDYLEKLYNIEDFLTTSWPSLAQKLKPNLHKQKVRMELLSACNPWHNLSNIAVQSACTTLNKDTKIISIVTSMIPITLIQLLYSDPSNSNTKTTAMLLKLCGLTKASEQFALLADALHNTSTPSHDTIQELLEPYPDLAQLISHFSTQQLDKLKQICQHQQQHSTIMESLCDLVISAITDTETCHGVCSDHLLEAMLEIISDFSLVSLADARAIDDHLPLWTENHPLQSSQLVTTQRWLLGMASQSAPLCPSLLLNIKTTLLFLSQIHRTWQQFIISPPTLNIFTDLIDSNDRLIALFFSSKHPDELLKKIQQSFLEIMPPSKAPPSQPQSYSFWKNTASTATPPSSQRPALTTTRGPSR